MKVACNDCFVLDEQTGIVSALYVQMSSNVAYKMRKYIDDNLHFHSILSRFTSTYSRGPSTLSGRRTTSGD